MALANSATVATSYTPGMPRRRPGKAVRIRRDPVTVIGDETRRLPLAKALEVGAREPGRRGE